MARISKRKLLLLFGDICLIGLAMLLAFSISLGRWASFSDFGEKAIPITFLFLAFLVSFYIFDLYNIRLKFRRTRNLVLIAVALVLTILGTIVFFYATPFSLSRPDFFLVLALTGIFILLWRLFFSSFFSLAGQQKNILIVGTGRRADLISSLIRSIPEFRLVGFITGHPEKEEFSGKKILGDYDSLKWIAAQCKVKEIVVTDSLATDNELIRSLINCRMQGITVSDIPKFYENDLQRLPVHDLSERWFLESEGFGRLGNRIYNRIKRLSDVLFSFLFLLLSIPADALIAILIKLTSPGSVIFRQERVGRNYGPFSLIKFRTMFVTPGRTKPKLTEANDPRVTGIGKILRKTRLDEIPQLINIIKGNMSLIGPRPESPYFVKQLMEKIPYYSLRFTIKPGLTGWAQVNYGYGASIEDAVEKLQYELYYIKNMSLILDVRIILKTIRIMLFGMGR